MSRSHRQHVRHAYRAAIALRVGSEVLMGSTVNLSRGGVCASLATRIAEGTDVEVDVQLVFEDERQSEPLHLRGRVLWCTELRGAHQVGLTFQQLDANNSVYLMMFLRYLDPVRTRGPTARPLTVDERFSYTG